MSVKWTGKVWDLDLPHGEAWVLMAMVDHADHQGKNIFPGVGLLAWKTGYSDKQVMRLIDKLIEKAIIVEDGKMPDGQVRYKADFSKAIRKPEYQGRKKLAQQRVDKMSTLEGRQNVHPESLKMSTHGQTFCPVGVDISSVSHDKERARVLTVMEPPVKPSHTPRARECVAQPPATSLSVHTFDDVLEFAETQQGIHSPLAVATLRHRDGTWDKRITHWLSEKDRREQSSRAEMPGERDDELLASFLASVRSKLNRESFERWFAPIRQINRAGQALYVLAPTAESKGWITSNYADILTEVLSELDLADFKIEFWFNR
ncbi:MAG: DnaA N-terminal domain-containing protein [Blastocatellia bacterium]